MKKYLIIGALLFLALFLRIYHYTDFPVGGETADETAWTFLGASLLQTGQPTSWSYFSPYQEKYVFALRENEAPLVRPSLDHPPLFSLLPGLAHSFKNNWQTFPSIKLIRLPMFLLGVINVGLFFGWAAQFFRRKKWAYLATLLYATVPSVVFASRLVVAENLLLTWTLLALIFLQRKNNFWPLIMVRVIAVLTKVSGSVVPLSILIFGLMSGQKKVAQAGLVGLVVGWLLFFVYGAIYNFSLFWQIIFSQAGRDLGLATLSNRLFLHPSVVEKIFFDGWLMLGLLGSIWWLMRLSGKNLKPEKYLKLLPVSVFLILNLLFIAVTSGEQTFHAWYDYPIYPLLIMASAALLSHVLKKQNYLLFVFMWLILLAVVRLALVNLGWYQNLSTWEMRDMIGLGALPLALQVLGQKKMAKVVLLILVGLLIAANVVTILSFNQTAYWETDSFFYYR